MFQANISTTKAQEAETTVASSKPLPVGTIIASFIEPREFYKLMDNRETFDREKSTWCYADGEGNILNTPYYVSRGANESRIEDLRGYFLRGLDPTGRIDPDGSSRIAGSDQPDTFGTHSHAMTYKEKGDKGDAAPVGKKDTDIAFRGANNFKYTKNPGSIGNPMKEEGGQETRPKNIAVYYYIKIR